MIEIALLLMLGVIIVLCVAYVVLRTIYGPFHVSNSPSPPNPIPEFKPRPKVAATDKKMRREFSVFYINGSCRGGVMYREGNIQMNDGELFSRLDQLVDKRVLSIRFKEFSIKARM